MSGTGLNSNEKTATTGITDDANSSTDVKPVSIFSTDYKKHDDLKQMLDSNKENLKLDAMKRIVGMIAKGKNASDLFPAVVKNVVSKNVEIKKLVYVYLMRYAEEQQDLALLSISTFQRALKDPNQLIRANALRVLSSIRVPIITTIMMLAIKEAVSDMSPYVRKTAANAITKLYSLDPELKEDLIMIIEKLLADKTILVAGSAIQAFEEVCPERIDLIHKNFRKLCNLLIDVDEWGQVVIINMLTRYARTQFVNPCPASEANKEGGAKDDEEMVDDDEDEDFDAKFNLGSGSRVIMDPDHRLLLRVTKPLLQSRNSAVVMAVAQLYYYVAPKNESIMVAKSLVRLLRSYREVQIIVLRNIVSMAQKNQLMFQPHQKSFYVHSNDSIQVKILKLEILTCLANPTNISAILREFQTYVLSQDKEFAAATIHAIGRCASTIKEVSENCLTGLVNLMSKKDETIVAESVVVIKRLLQLNPSKNGHIIKRMAKMTDKVTVPMARASILWLIGEYSDRVSKIAPDILRKMAKVFCEEENVVKLQILNLAVKLYLTNQKQVSLLSQYVLNLAKYDQNYDIRDRARFFRTLLLNNENCPNLAKHIKKILLAPKPAPVLQSAYKDSDQYQLGTLSHAIGARVNGYTDLPEFPGEAPDPSVRNVEAPELPASATKGDRRESTMMPLASKNHKAKTEKFYSDEEDEDEKSQSTEGADPTNDEDEEEEEEEDEEADATDKNESEEESDAEVKTKKKSAKKEAEESEESSSSESESSDESSSEESEDEEAKKKEAIKVEVKRKPVVELKKKIEAKKESTSESESESSSESSESASSESESEEEKPKPTKKAPQFTATKKDSPKKEAPQQQVVKNDKVKPAKTQPEVSLLDLDFSEVASSSSSAPIQPSAILSPSMAADLANLSSTSGHVFSSNQSTHVSKKDYELLNKINGNGLQIHYKFPRVANNFSNKMVTVELVFNNLSNGDFSSVTIGSKKLQPGVSMSEMVEFSLAKGSISTQRVGVDFNDTLSSVQFEMTAVYSNDANLGGTSVVKKWPGLTITCPIGELFQPGWSISENEFNKLQAKLKGMNEISLTVDDLTHANFMNKNMNVKILESVNICQIPSSQQDILKYAGLTAAGKAPMLLSLFFSAVSGKCHLNVNCDKIVLANMFVKEVKQIINNA